MINWPLRRQALSRGGNLYVRLLLGIDVRDATAGYRLFRREALEKIDLDTVSPPATSSRPTWPPAWCGPGCGRRGADRVRRAGPRRLQDGRRGGGRVAAPDHRWGLGERGRQLAHAAAGRRTR